MPVPEGQVPDLANDAAVDGLLDLIDQGFTNAVRDIWDFGTDLPGFVAREGPESPPAAAVKPILRLACRQWARGAAPQNLPGFDAAWGGICEPYLDDIGESPLPGSGLGVPFEGGQCPGVSYDINWSWSAGDFNSGPQTARRPGPLTFSREGTGTLDCGTGGDTYNVVTLLSSGGNVSIIAGCGAQIDSLEVVPVGGGPDTCGNPAPEYDPPKIRPGLPTLPPSIPVDIPGVGPINVGFEFSPSGGVVIGLPDIGVEVGIEDPFGLGGDGDGDGGAGGDDPPPGDAGEEGEPEEADENGDAAGCAPENSELVGLLIDIVEFPQSRAKYTDEVFRGVCYVYMGMEGLLDLQPAGAMLRSGQFVLAPIPALTCWRVRANTGYKVVVTPRYREVKKEDGSATTG